MTPVPNEVINVARYLYQEGDRDHAIDYRATPELEDFRMYMNLNETLLPGVPTRQRVVKVLALHYGMLDRDERYRQLTRPWAPFKIDKGDGGPTHDGD